MVPRKMEHNARKFPRNPEPGVSVGRPYRYFVGQVSAFKLINSDVQGTYTSSSVVSPYNNKLYAFKFQRKAYMTPQDMRSDQLK